MRGPHDVGGLEAGPIDTTPHEPSAWDIELDVVHALLGDAKRQIKVSDKTRFYTECLGHELYNTLTYYERWAAALCRQLIDKGVLTQDEIDAKVAELRDRAER